MVYHRQISSMGSTFTRNWPWICYPKNKERTFFSWTHFIFTNRSSYQSYSWQLTRRAPFFYLHGWSMVWRYSYLLANPKNFLPSFYDWHRIYHQAPGYLLIGDVLYQCIVDTILGFCLTHDETEHIINDFHARAYDDHLSSMTTTQNIIKVRYYWPSLFHDYIMVVKYCGICQMFTTKSREPPTPLHLVITIGPLYKLGFNFMECQPPSSNGHKYIIVWFDYFTKWADAMPTLNIFSKTTTWFFFNHIITCFGIPKQLVSDHGTHF